MADHFPSHIEFKEDFFKILSPEAGFYKVVVIYSIAISLLTLAVPISLQLLVDTVANIALLRAVLLIALLLFTLLFLSGVMYALRAYVMELFTRKLYARVSSEIAMTAMLAKPNHFEQNQNSDLFNRYFDILTIKKSVPSILTNGFTLILQSLIGFAVVSFYHFYFFIFCMILIFLIWLVWKIWGWRSIETGFHLSEAKYKTAAWLQSLPFNNEEYRSSLNPDFAMAKTDGLVEAHIRRQSDHFRNTYSQLIVMLILYACASAALLGMGGWLVITGQLTLGQLVAAELILSAIFVGLPQLAGYLENFYDVCAAAEEISRFINVKTEEPDKSASMGVPEDTTIKFSNVNVQYFNQNTDFNIELPKKALVRVTGNHIGLASLTELVRRNISPSSGIITIGGIDNIDIHRQELRQVVNFINRVSLPPMTIKDYLDLFVRKDAKHSRQEALTILKLDSVIAKLDEGMNTMLSRGGWPLSQPQAIRLKLATALLSEPKVLTLEDIVDAVDADVMDPFLEAMKGLGSTVLYYTLRDDIDELDYLLKIENSEQSIVSLKKGEE